MENQFENKESLPLVETVRVALYFQGKFLLLEKDKTSKNPNALEFPGGKIDDIENKNSTLVEQERTVREEVLQETGIDLENLPIQKIEDFTMYFETKGENGRRNRAKRLVHLFLVRLPIEVSTQITVNQIEDKHKGGTWVSPEELINATTELSENHTTGENVYPLARNSRHIKKLLSAVGYM